MIRRTINEAITDRILLLHVIDKINQKGKIENLLKLQKIIFSIENRLVQKRIKAINYMFFRWNKGPFSADVSADVDFLTDNNLINHKKENIKTTETGKLILKECSKIFENNISILKIFYDVIEYFSNKNPDEIKKEIYDSEIFVPHIKRKMKIETISKGVPLIFKISERNAKTTLNINENWIDTIEELLEIDEMNLILK